MPPPAQQNAATTAEIALSRRLVEGYLAHSGLWPHPQQQQHKQLDPQTAEVQAALLALTDEYEARFRDSLRDMAADWHVDGAHPRENFNQVLDTLFEQGANGNWGRVITLFIFAGMFARLFAGPGGPVTVEEVADWSVAYLVDQLGPWIRANGGWMGLARFYRGGHESDDAAGGGDTFQRLMTMAGAGLALLGLGSLLTNRA